MIAIRALLGPGLILGGAVAIYGVGYHMGSSMTEKAQLELDNKSSLLADKMRQAVVEEVSKIKVESKTYVRNFKEIEKVSPVFVDCKLPGDAQRLLNSTLKGGQQPLPSKLPE